MKRSLFARLMLVLLLVFGSVTFVSAQAFEAYMFGGGYWSGNKIFEDSDVKMPGGGTYGVKVGGFLADNFALDGNLSWYNHFAVGDPTNVTIFRPVTNVEDPEVRGLLWEGSGTWHFGQKQIGTRFTPYITVGVGGMTARLKNADEVFVTGGGFVRNPLYINALSPVPQFIPNPARQIVMEDGDTFLTFSYGGGVKVEKAWGPAGFRADFRGRTIPNFYSRSLTRPEITAGLILSWGER